MNLLKQIALTWIQYRHFQAVLAELKRLPDHELSDLGLARGDIVRAAFEEAERRTQAAFARSRPKGTLRGRRSHGAGANRGHAGSWVLGKAELVSSGQRLAGVA